jgi:hypothetical protein
MMMMMVVVVVDLSTKYRVQLDCGRGLLGSAPLDVEASGSERSGGLRLFGRRNTEVALGQFFLGTGDAAQETG